MDYLREGIHLRGFAQIDPLVAYKNEAFELFADLMNSVWADFARMVFNVEVEVEGTNGSGTGAPLPARAAGGSSSTGAQVNYSGGAQIGGAEAIAMALGGAGVEASAEAYEDGQLQDAELLPVVEQRRVDDNEQIGRNDPCWCGSGKKFKKCHGA
jgi:preprotein translocase subunit SecA